MAGEWQSMPFGRLLAEPVRNGIYKQKEFHGHGVKIVNMGELFAHPRLRAVPMKRVELSGSESERFMLARGDLIFARRSLVAEGAGKCSVVLDIDEPTTFESSIIRARPDGAKADTLFLYYFFNSTTGLHCLDTIRRQVAVAGITGSDLAQLEVSVPPLSEQHAIAHILGTLDDKIELNRRMNETLEAMARALFKSWFVNFDLVRAKNEGRDSGLPKYIADLFPDSFKDSELGKIPNEWMVRPLYNTVSFVNGAAFKNKDFCDSHEGLPVIKIAELKDGISSQTKYSCRTLGDIQHIDTGDLLYSWSGSPDTSLDTFLWKNGPGLLNQHIFKVLVSDTTQKRFVYYLLKYLRPVLVEIARDKQTTGLGHVTVADLKRLLVCWPSSSVLLAFDKKIAPLFDRSFLNMIESCKLAVLRDTLLPKLISGELRVTNADHFLETRKSMMG
jgi:type I restriction enzyme, S subunit